MEHVKGFDLHQFAIFKSEYSGDAERCHREQCYNCLGRNEEKVIVGWQRLLSEWNPKLMHSGKLHRLMQKGIPHHLRGTVWKQLLQIDALKEKSQFSYQADQILIREQLVDIGFSEYSQTGNFGIINDDDILDAYNPKGTHLNVNTLRDIILDLDRSFPTHRMFMDGYQEGIEGRASLFRILAGYARYNAKVGYCQGMSYVAGMLLMNLAEADAFWCFVAIMERQRYLRGYYHEHLKKIRTHANVFHELLRSKLPTLSDHLNKHGVMPDLYIIPWFLSLFTNLLCWDSVLAIWDLFVLDGMLALFRASLALLSVLESELLEHQDMSHILPCLLHPSPEKVHFEIFVPMLWALTLEDWEVKYMEAVIQENPHPGTMSKKRAIEDAEDSMSPKRARRSPLNDNSNNNMASENEKENLSIFQRFKQVFFRRNSHPAALSSGHCSANQRRRQSAASWRRSQLHLSPNRLTSPSRKFGTPARSSPRFANNNFLKQRNLNTPSHQNMPKQASTKYTFKAFSSLKAPRLSDRFDQAACLSPMEMTEIRKTPRRESRKILKI